MFFLGDSVIALLILSAFFVFLTIFFNFGRKIRMQVQAKKISKKALTILDISSLPLHKNGDVNWELLEGKAKKLPDSRDKYMFLRDIREQKEYNKALPKKKAGHK